MAKSKNTSVSNSLEFRLSHEKRPSRAELIRDLAKL